MFALPNITDLLQGEHPEIFDRNRGGVCLSKKRLLAYKSCNISETRQRYDKINVILLRTSRKSHTRFRLVPKSTTSDDL